MLRPRIALFACLVLAAAQARLKAGLGPEAGTFQINTFSAKTYGASPQVWDIAQDRRGVMYFGNTDGILEYDGVRWRRIAVDNGIVRVLATDANGTIYAGGDGVVGYLRPDAIGRMQFVSMVESIPPADRHFGIVQNVLATADGIYFSSQTRLFRFRGDKHVTVWSTAGGFRRVLFRAFGRIYVSSRATGPLTVENERLVPCAWGKLLKEPLVSEFHWNGVVLVASSKRIFRLSENTIEPFPTDADEYLSKHRISLLSQLPNGDLVVGTVTGGLVILETGRTVRILNRASGLPSNWVTKSFADHSNDVWIATNSGLAYFVPSLTRYSEAQGIKGNVYAVGRQGGVLYAGSTAGLYRLRSSAITEPAFEPVEAVRSAITVWTIVNAGGISFAGADDGVYSISGQQVTLILSAQQVYDLHPSRHDPNLIYTAGRDGVLVLKRFGSAWMVVHQEKGNGQEFRTVAEDVDGRIWATTRVDVWRFDFSSNPTRAERFDSSHGIPSGWKNVYQFRNHIIFATERGLLQFSEPKQLFVPDTELGTQFADGSKAISVVKEDDLHNVWVSGKGFHGFLRRIPSGGFEWVEMPLIASAIEETWCLNIDGDGTVWAAGEEGILFRWNPKDTGNPRNQDFRALIRELSVAESKTTLFGGDGPEPSALQIPFRQNALRFEFAAPFFQSPSAVQYQFRLDNNEREWSPWTTETHKDFTNLPPRNFRFRVRARSPHGQLSPETTLSFQVLPPWYRTWWAYCLYFVGGTFLSWILFRWRLRVLRAHNQQLEKIVEERTAEVRTQRDQNEALLLNILPATIASELRDSGAVAPTMFENVTVCFTDFVGFTLSSEKLSPDLLVTTLNEYFTAFDAIMIRYGLEKLKTIGDSYMFASGMPEQRSSHAVDAVLAALEMLHAARDLARPDQETNWKMRVGLYSGPVVAGVVGKSKFTFDIWGNTVNLASRMESSGAPDRVNLSNSTCCHVLQFIDCEARGRIRIKEGRELEMHFALGVKPELLEGPLIDGVPAAFRAAYEAAFAQPPRAFPTFLVKTQTTLSLD